MRRGWFTAIAIAALAVPSTGCENEEGTPTPELQSTTEQAAEPEGAGGFTGKDAQIYRLNKQSCGSFSPEEVARDYHLDPDTDPVAVAERMSTGFGSAHHQAALEGCLAGFGLP